MGSKRHLVNLLHSIFLATIGDPKQWHNISVNTDDIGEGAGHLGGNCCPDLMCGNIRFGLQRIRKIGLSQNEQGHADEVVGIFL